MISFQLAATMEIYKFKKKAIDTILNTQIFSQKTTFTIFTFGLDILLTKQMLYFIMVHICYR